MRKPTSIGYRSTRSSEAAEKKEEVAKLSEDVKHKEEDSDQLISGESIAAFRSQILAWYDQNKRVLPWRTTVEERRREAQTAYCIWVSEVMLQQTRVETVKAYYARWMKEFPTLQDLANSDLDQVNKLWAGLGYYRRAKFLLEGSRYVRDHFKGELPTNVEDLLKIPGVGLYTASAVASIAYGRRAGVVDGNVIRVFSRLRALSGDPRSPKNTKLQWKLANDLVDVDRPGCFNQALMELGATVCTPKNPKCGSCPVSSHCLALRKVEQWKQSNPNPLQGIKKKKTGVKKEENGDIDMPPSVTDYPEKVKKKAPREETIRSCLVVLRSKEKNKGGKGQSSLFFLVKRPPTGLLAGLWEFPNILEKEEEDGKKAMKKSQQRDKLVKLLRGAVSQQQQQASPSSAEAAGGGVFGKFSAKDLVEIGSFVHVFSHIRQTNVVDHATVDLDQATLDAIFVMAESSSSLPLQIHLVRCDCEKSIKTLSTGVRKAINLYTKHNREKKTKISNFFAKKEKK